MSVVRDFIAWWASLSAEFRFVLALPFIVAAAGLIKLRTSSK